MRAGQDFGKCLARSPRPPPAATYRARNVGKALAALSRERLFGSLRGGMADELGNGFALHCGCLTHLPIELGIETETSHVHNVSQNPPVVSRMLG